MMWNEGYPINWRTPLNSGLTGWWLRPPTLVSNARWMDLGGKYPGALSGGPLWAGALGRPGGWGAMRFTSATTTRVTTSVALSNFLTASAGTVAVWANPAPTVATASSARMLPGLVSSPSGGMTITIGDVSGGGNRLWVYNSDGAGASVGTPYTDDVWTHIVWVHRGGTLYLYKDGVLAASVASVDTASLTGLLEFGGNSAWGTYYTGLLDDLRTYSRGLSADEIAASYHASATGYQQELNWIGDFNAPRRPAAPQTPRPYPPSVFLQAVNRASRY